MSESSNISDSYHPTAIQLPFYLNGTLSGQERQEVDMHLSECPSCQQELDEMRSLRTEVRTHFSTLPQPPADIFNKVKSQILAESAPEKAGIPVVRAQTSESLGSRIQNFLQSIFATPWAPALAMCLILGQAGLLFLTLNTSPAGKGSPAYGPVIERTVPQAPLLTSKLHIAFVDQTSEQAVRTIIQDLNGRIVDGPTQEGIYTVEIPGNDPKHLDSIIQELMNQKEVIRLAEPLPPLEG